MNKNIKTNLLQIISLIAFLVFTGYLYTYTIIYHDNKGNISTTDIFIENKNCKILKNVSNERYKICEAANKIVDENNELNTLKSFLLNNTNVNVFFMTINEYLEHNEKIEYLQYEYLFNKSNLINASSLNYKVANNIDVDFDREYEDNERMKKTNNEILVAVKKRLHNYSEMLKTLTSLKLALLNTLYCFVIFKFLILSFYSKYNTKITKLKNESFDNISNFVLFSVIISFLF